MIKLSATPTAKGSYIFEWSDIRDKKNSITESKRRLIIYKKHGMWHWFIKHGPNLGSSIHSDISFATDTAAAEDASKRSGVELELINF